MKPHLAILMLSVFVLPAWASAQTPPPPADNTQPLEEQAERNAALKSGNKAAIARATADEDAAFAKWRRDHPGAAAVTPQSKAAFEAKLAARRHRQPDDSQPLEEQAERNAALKSGNKAAIAQATADEDAAFAKWRREHPAAAAVTPQSKAAFEAKLAARRHHHRHPAA